uniref:Uncharacterized protein n=1 Tax=Oryza nivara TaxID=4536 RepID=A0A0E0IUJ5_ORYNI
MHVHGTVHEEKKEEEEEEEGEKETRKTAQLNGCGSGSVSCVIAKRPTPASLREAAPAHTTKTPRATPSADSRPALAPCGAFCLRLGPFRRTTSRHRGSRPADSTVLPLAPDSSAGHAGLKSQAPPATRGFKYTVVAKDPAHLDRSASWASASASAVC